MIKLKQIMCNKYNLDRMNAELLVYSSVDLPKYEY